VTKDRKLDRLYRRFQERGDVSALGKVFDLAAPELLGIARHLCGDEAEAEDALQATFLAAIEKRAQYDPERRFLPWMIGILAHRAMEARRRAERVPDPARIPERAAADPLSEASERELRERLGKTVEELPATYAGAVREYLVEGRSPSEIASALGISLNAAHVRIHRGLKLLRKALPPSFAVGSVLCLVPSRGLAAIRAEILRHAAAAFPAAAPALAVCSAATVATVGGAFVGKKAVLAGLAVVLATVGSGLLLSESTRSTDGDKPAVVLGSIDEASSRGRVGATPDPSTGPSSRTPLPSPAERPAVAVLALRDPARRPLAAARAAVWIGAEILLAAKANEAGEVSVPANGEIASLLAIVPSTAIYREEVALTAGWREVVVDEGSVLSGWVVVDGHAPSEPLEISLQSDHPLGRTEGVPAGVWERLRLPGAPSELEQRTDEAGAFRFAGLSRDWSGTLHPPEGYEVRDPALGAIDFAPIERPVEGLHVEFARLPALTGRIVETRSGEPVPNPLVRASLVLAGGMGMPDVFHAEIVVGGTADESGRFRVPIGRYYQGFHRGSIEFSAEDGRGRRSFPFERARLPAGWDLGDLELAAGREIRFVVRDPSGRPVPNAVALLDDDPERRSEPTDAHGRGAFPRASGEARRLVVGALGHATAEAPAPREGDEPLEITLPTSTVLEVLVRARDGDLPRDLEVALFSREPLFAGEEGWNPARVHEAAGASRCLGGSVGVEGGTRIFEMNGSGRTRVCSIRPSLSLTLRVVDPFGFAVEGREIAPLAESETRVVEAVVRARPRLFTGRVLDEDGRPLAGAQLSPQFGPTGSSVRTDATGTFRCERFYADRAGVRIERAGFVTLDLPDVRIPEDGTPLEFRMTRGFRVVVHVEDEEGNPVSASVTARTAEGRVFGSRPFQDGRYELADPPEEDLVIRALVGGREYDRRHSPPASEARIVVPVHGRVEVSVDPSFDVGDDFSTRVALVPKGGDLPRREAIVIADRDVEAPFVFPDVLPGSYEACLQRKLGKGDGRTSDPREDLSSRVPVEVKAGEVVRVSLRR
jgi:RNA polymerase sigma factor (sigma-70 family)